MQLLFLTDFYPPGFRSGGPARSCYYLSVGLGISIPVYVFTRDRDLGSTLPYPDLTIESWIPIASNVQAWYISPSEQHFWAMLRRLRQFPGAVIYLNSMFSVPFTIYPLLARWLGLIKGRVVLAPRGMLKASALQFKPWKKKIFLTVFRVLGWHRLVVFQASSQAEMQDIHAVFGTTASVETCPLIPNLDLLAQRTKHHKSNSLTRFCLVGRIHPIKNCLKALALLSLVNQAIQVDVIGPIEDEAYWLDCHNIAKSLPAVVQVYFHGALSPLETQDLLAQTDFFYLLTQGENFGHAIFEALALGKPAIISDQTPWRQLRDKKAGWDLDLQNEAAIQQVLQLAVQMNDEEYQNWSDGAYECARQYAKSSNLIPCYYKLFYPTRS